MTVYHATNGFQWPDGVPPDLPSEAGVLLGPGASNRYASWAYQPYTAPWTPTPLQRWTVEVDAEAVDPEFEVAVSVGMSHHDSDIPNTEVMAHVGPILDRQVYVGTGGEYQLVSVGGSNDVVWCESYPWGDAPGPVIVHSIRWWPSSRRAVPLRQLGRTDGLLGAPRQVGSPSVRTVQHVY